MYSQHVYLASMQSLLRATRATRAHGNIALEATVGVPPQLVGLPSSSSPSTSPASLPSPDRPRSSSPDSRSASASVPDPSRGEVLLFESSIKVGLSNVRLSLFSLSFPSRCPW